MSLCWCRLYETAMQERMQEMQERMQALLQHSEKAILAFVQKIPWFNLQLSLTIFLSHLTSIYSSCLNSPTTSNHQLIKIWSMWCLAQFIAYINLCVTLNKSVLNWTQVCQLHWKTQLHDLHFNTVSLLWRHKKHKCSCFCKDAIASLSGDLTWSFCRWWQQPSEPLIS